jgi:hypothetical protein
VAGSVSFAIALLHVACIFIGADAYRYFGAGEEMATLASQGSYIPALLTAGITLVFIIFACYTWSGAKIIKKLPLLKGVFTAITIIYLLGGLGFFVEVTGIMYQCR